ncbi:MAG: SLC13 family permease, partial [Polyangia bacterium]|nr:SLC13 family permease [Polyangia bacterium]
MSLPFDASIAFLFLIIGAMVVLFLTEKLPLDLTAFLGLAVLVVAGYVKPEEAFQGFASPAVITMLSVFFVSAGLQQTGVASIMGRHLHRLVGSREVPLMAAVMLVAALLSAFMFNVAAAAVLLPAVVSLAREASLAPARLLIPLAFGAILGGTITLVGTPPNLLASQVLTEHGLKPFGLLDFAPFGLALLGAGILYMITVGRRLLPKGTAGMAETERADLASVYHIEDRLFSLRLPESSPLVGKSLEEARLGSVLGVQVVSIVREGEEILAPGPSERIQEGDQLLVEGRRLDLEERLELQDVHLSELGTGSLHLGSSCSEVCGIILRLVKGSPFIGKSLREHGLGKTPRVTVAAIWRDGDPIRDELADLRLKAQDELLVIGDPQATSELATRTDLDVVLEGSHAMRRLEGGLFSLPVPDGSVLVGKTLEDAHLRKRLGLTVIGVLRGEAMELFGPGDHVRAGDRLLVTGRPSQVAALVDLGHVEVGEARPHPGLESEEIGLVEAVVAPRSAAVGKTLRELSFRKRYGLRALAIWRGNRPVRFGLPDLRLQLGDGLLLHGRRDRVPLLRADPDFVVLTTDQSAVTRSSRAPFALAALLLMIVLVMTGVFPIQVA